MNRRALLRAGCAVAPLVLFLAACGTTTVAQIAAQVTADVDLVAQALDAQLPAIQAATGAGAAAAQIASEIQQIVAAAAVFAVATTQAAGQPIVTQIATDFAALQKALAGFSLPSSIQNILSAVAALLPIIEVGVGLFTASAPAGGMTPAQARAVLMAAR